MKYRTKKAIKYLLPKNIRLASKILLKTYGKN